MVDSGGDEDEDDDEGNGCFDIDEITDICQLTFKDFQKPPVSDDEDSGDEEGSEKEDILKQTAQLQAKSIFERLGYALDDEIPIEVF